MKNHFVLLLLMLLGGCQAKREKIRLRHDGYEFTLPMTVGDAEKLFSLNEKMWGGRIARVDGRSCKEIQITHFPGIADSILEKNMVEAVSFYHRESMDSLKRSLEREYNNQFEPVYYYQTNNPHYYLMHEGRFTVILYPTNFRACLNHEAAPREQRTLPEMASVVAFTRHYLTNESHFDAFVAADGSWRD